MNEQETELLRGFTRSYLAEIQRLQEAVWSLSAALAPFANAALGTPEHVTVRFSDVARPEVLSVEDFIEARRALQKVGGL